MAPFVLNFWFVLNPTWFSTQTCLRIVRWDSTQNARCKSVVVGIQHKQPDLEMSPLRFNTNSPISKCGSLDSTQTARSLNLVAGIQHKRLQLQMWFLGFNTNGPTLKCGCRDSTQRGCSPNLDSPPGSKVLSVLDLSYPRHCRRRWGRCMCRLVP